MSEPKNLLLEMNAKNQKEKGKKSDSLTTHEEEVISFHMYAIKALLLQLAWVATLHLRHAAMMISFDRLFFCISNDRYQTWGYCAEIMASEYV